jgi:glycosyltransferase involved in cell wall biosynthesis
MNAIGHHGQVIGISMLTLSPGRMGGSETYARALTAALRLVGTEDYLVAVPAAARDAASGLPNVQVARRADAGRVRTFASAARHTGTLRHARVVHYPFTVPLPRVHVPSVITLHDVLHRDHPSLVPRSTRAFRLVAYDRAARASQRVIVPSAFVRDRAVATLGLDPDRVRVVPHGVDHRSFRLGSEAREPFVLYPARRWPHKNHDRLFEAFAEVRRRSPNLELVLTGDSAGGPLPPGIRTLGRVSLEELSRLYRTASATVFPSMYEGFGAPVLEAMASGCPVAAADAAALREVAGDAAVLFDPRDPAAIAWAILRAIDEVDALAPRGVEWAARFTWEASARSHEAVYQELLE